MQPKMPTNEQVIAGRIRRSSPKRSPFDMLRMQDFWDESTTDDRNIHEKEDYKQVNLHELEAYTEKIRATERRRERIQLCRILTVFCIMGLVYYFVTGDGHRDNNSSSQIKENGSANIDIPADMATEKAYHIVKEEKEHEDALTTCERDLNHNSTFFQLLHSVQVDDGEVPHCRPEVKDCDWLNPALPAPRQDEDPDVVEAWKQTFADQETRIESLINRKEGPKKFDVILLGGTLIEHMEGKELGLAHSSFKRHQDAFLTRFSKLGGGLVEGMALGISGDRCANLLYRLHNGKQLLTYEISPKVWWIVIGTQDWELGASPESIVAGLIAIVREIRTNQPKAQIVVNSLLPHASREQNDTIERINQLLACYVHSQSLMDEEEAYREQQQSKFNSIRNNANHFHRRLHFFNATSVFVSRQDDGSYQVNPDLFVSGGDEPNPNGAFSWGKHIVEKVMEIVQQNGNNHRKLSGSAITDLLWKIFS